jgi:hypothetical protein
LLPIASQLVMVVDQEKSWKSRTVRQTCPAGAATLIDWYVLKTCVVPREYPQHRERCPSFATNYASLKTSHCTYPRVASVQGAERGQP